MKTVNKTAGGLNYDDSGFLVGKRRLEQNVRSIEQDTKKIITLLEAQLQARQANPPAHQLTSFQKAIIEANRRVTIDAVDQLIASNNRQPRGQTHPKPTIDSDSLGQHSTPRPDQSPSAPNSGSQPLPNRSRFPNRRTLDTDNPADVRDLGQQQRRNAINQQRDAKGRFGNGAGSSGSNESAALNKISDRLKDSLKEIHVPQGVDPTVDAVNELGAVLKPAGVLFKRGKRNEPLSRDEEKHNREVIKQLRRIGGSNGSGGNGGMLAMLRFLPLMIGAIVAAIGAATAAALGMGGGNKITELLQQSEGGQKTLDTIGKVTARTLAWFGNKDAQEAVAANDKAADAERYKDRQENPAWYSNDGVYRFARKFGIDGWLKEDEPVADGKPASDGKAVDRIAEGGASLDGKNLNVAVYNAYKKNGLSHEQALAMTAEVGRENDFNANVIFGKHTDLAKDGKGKSITNMGMLSWNRERAAALQEHLKKRGALDKNGNIIRSQAALDAQAEFSVNEMKSDKYKDKLNNFFTNPNADPEIYAQEVGKNYVGWAYGQNSVKGSNGKRTPFDYKLHDNKRRGYLKQTTKDLNIPPTQPDTTAYNRLNTNPAKPTQQVAVIPLMANSPRSAPQLAPIQPIPAVKEPLSSKAPQIVQLASSSDNIGQNVADRDIAHGVTGGLGARTWDA